MPLYQIGTPSQLDRIERGGFRADTRPSHKPGMVQTTRKVGGSGYPAGIEVTADFRPGGIKTRKECQ